MKFFKLIGTLLDYPSDEILAELRIAAQLKGSAGLVADCDPDGVLNAEEKGTLAGFIDSMLARDPLELQGAYVRDFDLTAEHSLHLTHHIFGEEKTRGPALIDLGAIEPVFHFEVPLALLFLPAKSDAASRHTRLSALAVEHQQFPLAVFDGLVT